MGKKKKSQYRTSLHFMYFVYLYCILTDPCFYSAILYLIINLTAVVEHLSDVMTLSEPAVFPSRPSSRSSGGEGPVVHRPGGGGDPMGDHRSGCVATTCQTVHERGCVPGRVTHSYLQQEKKKVSIPNVFFLHSKPLHALIGRLHASC